VQREHRHFGLVARREALEGLAGCEVQTGSCPIREAVVHHVADQAVLEAVAERAVGLEEPAELGDGRLVEFEALAAEELVDDHAPEAPTEHGGVRQHPLGEGIEGVDLRRQRALQRRRYGIERTRAPERRRSARRRTSGSPLRE
jgi:hypothetical protein